MAKEKSLLAACAGEFIVKLVDVGCEIFAASIVMELCQGTLPTKVRDVKFVSKASHQLLNPGKNWCAIHNGFHDVGGTPGVSTDCPRFLFMHIIFSLFFPSLSTLFLHVFEAFCPRFSFVFSSFMSTCSLFFFRLFCALLLVFSNILSILSTFFSSVFPASCPHVHFFLSSLLCAVLLVSFQPFVRGSSCFFSSILSAFVLVCCFLPTHSLLFVAFFLFSLSPLSILAVAFCKLFVPIIFPAESGPLQRKSR